MNKSFKPAGWVFVTLASLALGTALFAASPPALVNYQGVLRSIGGDPLTGNQNMVFTFYSAASGGDQILLDSHTASDGNPVSVSNGLFTTQLGGGILSDGAGPGTYGTLAEVFRDYGAVYMAITVGGEVMSPRVQVISSPYALNCDTLDGLDSAAFAASSHPHSGADITSGTVLEGRIDALIARDAEIMPTVLANDGAGSTLDADFLDGQHASAFSLTGHNHTGVYLPLAGGTMAGNIAFSGAQTVDGIDLSTSATTWNNHVAATSNVHGLTFTAEGAGGGLDADLLDGSHESAFFNLSQDESVTGRPAFNGGTPGSTSPFSVDSNFVVASLNADFLDGQHASAFMGSGTDDWVNTTGDTMTGSLQLNPTTAKGIIGVAALNTTQNIIDVENTGAGTPIVGRSHYSAPTFGSSIGVRGVADGASGMFASSIGVKGTADGASAALYSWNFGVSGTASNAESNYAVWGTASGDTGTKYGVLGTTSGSGVNYGGSFDATSETATSNYGIKATASGANGTGSANYAGYFDGNTATGTLNYAGYFDGNVRIVNGKLTTAVSSASFAGFNLPHGAAPSPPTNGDIWTTTAGLYARISGTTIGPITGAGLDHGTLSGLADDDHPQYFNLSQPEDVIGIPNFNGGTSGTSAPFTVDSYTTVTSLSADYLDGYTEAAFFRLATNETVTGVPAFNGGTASAAPFSVDSTFLVTNLNADLLDGQHASAFGNGYSLSADDGSPTHVVYVDSTGDVGVGTVAPGAKLHVHLDSSNYVMIGNVATTLALNVHTEDPADGDDQSALYGFRTRSAQNNGTAYTMSNTNKAIEGFNFWGDAYTFGIAGHSYTDFDRSGAILGATDSAGSWGALAYRASGGTVYGGYFTTSGSGAGFGESNTGIGIGSYGNLMGGWVRGEEYGLYTSGKRFGSFTNGNGFTTGYQAFMQEGTSGRSVTYAIASPSVDVMIHGTAKLAAGETMVPFPPKFAELFSEAAPVTVFVSPVGQTAPLSVASSSARGFEIGGADGRATEAQFAWIAIGSRKGYENVEVPSEVLAADFEANMEQVAFDENNLQGSGLGMVFDGSLRFGPPPESPRDEGAVRREDSAPATGSISDPQTGRHQKSAQPQAPLSGAGSYVASRPGAPGEGAITASPAPGQALFNVKEAVETGDVLVLNPANGDELYRCQRPSDPMVVGISGGDAGAMGEVPVFQYGTSWVRVDAQYGPIARGDLLTTSTTPGHAMRAPRPIEPGTVIGKALEPLESGTGLIKVLVMLR